MEVMVSVSIFAIVLTVGIVGLITINDAYRKSQTSRQAIDSLTYIIESMSRRIRTASPWDSGITFGSPATSFKFVDQDNIGVTYRFDGVNAIYMDITNPGNVGPIATGSYNLTPNNIIIKGLTFLPFGGQGKQSYVQMNVEGSVTDGKETSDFAFQTSVSKRVLDQ